MKKFFLKAGSLIAVAVLGVSAFSCSNYLDVVPDNVLQYEDLFVSRLRAYNALASVYYGLPYEQMNNSPWTLGDEWVVVNPDVDNNRTSIQGAAIMRGGQSTSNSILSYWTGTNLWYGSLWTVIRNCDMFVLNVDRIPDMTMKEKEDWKGQAKFLKAYYMFMMVQMYGPIIIPKTVDPGDLNSDLFLPRSKVEDCFDYIVDLMDEAISMLKERVTIDDLGQVDRVTAISIKARVLLLRASPFYNGNSEYYGNFLDHNGDHFFSQTYNPEKWKAAADTADEALKACEQSGIKLYHYKGVNYSFDAADCVANSERMQTLYDLRGRVTERWNEEVIWGNFKEAGENSATLACIRKPPSYGGPAPDWDREKNGYGGASYQVMERYYTEHGLPLEEDSTVDLNALHDIINMPDENSEEYARLRGYMQPGVPTIRMYMNREPRFYSDLGITGGYYRSHQVRINTMMFQNSDGGYVENVHGLYMNPTGIAIQKTVHPEEYFVSRFTQKGNPVYFIRMADIYLMKAEAMNEYYGPSQEVYDAVNEVRRRAGIPDVEESYGADSQWVTDEARDKHLTKEGMREIILRERANELAFELGHRFWDMQRWKRSISEFSRPIYGWNFYGTNSTSFFRYTVVQGRKWSITDCLWPIEDKEMDKNAKLIQNPGW